jgi:hypothetical protein
MGGRRQQAIRKGFFFKKRSKKLFSTGPVAVQPARPGFKKVFAPLF